MSRQNDEGRYNKAQSNAGKKPARRKSNYIVFRPSAEERKTIKEDKAPIGGVVADLIRRTMNDAKLVIGYRAENEAHFVHLTDIGVDWQDAITLSVFHTDWETALRTLEYGLKTRYSEFPEIQLELFSDDTNW